MESLASVDIDLTLLNQSGRFVCLQGVIHILNGGCGQRSLIHAGMPSILNHQNFLERKLISESCLDKEATLSMNLTPSFMHEATAVT